MATLKESAERLARAVTRAAEEHGTPNGFGFGELEAYGGPPALLAGRAARLYPRELDAVDAVVRNGRIEVGAVICGKCEAEWQGPATDEDGEPAECPSPHCGQNTNEHVVRGVES